MKIALSLILIASSLVSMAQTSYLISGSGWREVGLVNSENAELLWTYPLLEGEDCNDIEMTKDGNILIGAKKSAKLLTWDKEVIWEVTCDGKISEINTAKELTGKLAKVFGGRYLLAYCGAPSRIEILDDNGKKVKEIKFETGVQNPHGQFRQVTPLATGEFYVPVIGGKKVVKYSHEGKALTEYAVEGNPFAVTVLKDKNIAVSCGDGHKIMVINPETKENVSSIEEKDINGVSLLFVGEIVSTKSGGYVITNWNGHSKDKTQTKLLEIDKNNNALWTLPVTDEIRNISAVYPMPKKFKIK